MFRERFLVFPFLFIFVAALVPQDELRVSKGQLTFDAEGIDNPRSRFFSRRLHVPSRWSGVTIGRGYDMKYKSKQRVEQDFSKAAISSYYAKKISTLVGKTGQAARDMIKNRNLQYFTITRHQQKALFEITYARQEKETIRLVRKYYKLSWENLHSKIKEILVDLKFRGDFRPRSKFAAMKGIKSAVQKNSIAEFKTVISNRSIWRSVPYDRFRRRKNAF